jgi:hypothetical protein
MMESKPSDLDVTKLLNAKSEGLDSNASALAVIKLLATKVNVELQKCPKLKRFRAFSFSSKNENL